MLPTFDFNVTTKNTCVLAVNCSPYPTILHGSIIRYTKNEKDGRYPFQTTVYFQCDLKYWLSGPQNSLCVDPGKWSTETTKCLPSNKIVLLFCLLQLTIFFIFIFSVTCDPQDPLTNGQLDYRGIVINCRTIYGSVCTDDIVKFCDLEYMCHKRSYVSQIKLKER